MINNKEALLPRLSVKRPVTVLMIFLALLEILWLIVFHPPFAAYAARMQVPQTIEHRFNVRL